MSLIISDNLKPFLSTFSGITKYYSGKNFQAKYYENCGYDVAMTENKKEAACATLETVAKECGCDVGEWRKLANCRMYLFCCSV